MGNFFDNFKTTMKNVGTGISDKTREMTRNAKLSAEINGAKSNMENTFAEIGKKYYAMNASSPAPELAELCQKIDEYKKQINEKELEIKKNRGERICCECGKTITDKTATFCPFCGTKIDDISMEAECEETDSACADEGETGAKADPDTEDSDAE